MKIYCPNCSGVSELTTVPREGQNLECPYCNQKFSYSVRMSMLRSAKRERVAERTATDNIKSGSSSIENRNLSNLIVCVDCRHSVSKRAKICPNCGAPLVREAEISPSRRIAALLIAILLGCLGWHNYYLGYKRRGKIQFTFFFGCLLMGGLGSEFLGLDFLGSIFELLIFLMWIWGIFEVCAYSTDGEGRRLEW